MPKRTKICFNVCQMIWNKKNRPKKISANSGHIRGGGGPMKVELRKEQATFEKKNVEKVDGGR